MENNYINFLKEIKNKKSLVLSSISEQGYPISRAMLIIDKQWSIDSMYFSTNTSSKKIAEFQSNSKASIYYYDETTFQGINLIGHIDVLQNQDTKDLFWCEGDEQYYKLGKTDPDYSILKFTPLRGSYYNSNYTIKFSL